MNENIKIDHGPLCSLYKSQDNGDFRSEGESFSFMHAIPTGLRNLESPDWGGWAVRYTNVRDNTWLDPVAEPGYQYPEGRWYTNTAWGRERLRKEIPNAGNQEASFTVPDHVHKGKTIPIICEVTDIGSLQLTRYSRVVVESDTTFVTKMDNRGFESSGFDLKSNYPNPFNPVTTLEYGLNKPNKSFLTL